MRFLILSAVVAALGLPNPSGAQPSGAPAALAPVSDIQTAMDCAPRGKVKFICGPSPAEDFVSIPGTDWVLADSRRDRAVGLRVFSVRNRTATTIYPSAAAQDRPDKEKYGACPGPMEAGDYITHGVSLLPAGPGRYKLFAVHHGKRESVEVFEIDARAKTPSATWVGCAVHPDATVFLNAVAGLPDGGFITTNFSHHTPGQPNNFEKVGRGLDSGELWEWRPANGWIKLPGSETSGPNGVEISKDGKWLYIAASGNRSLIRLSRGVAPQRRDMAPLGFVADNVRWASDGSLFIAGRTLGEPNGSKAVRIDPETLTMTTLIEIPDTPAFGFGTTAILVGKEIWMGSTRWSSIATFPAPK